MDEHASSFLLIFCLIIHAISAADTMNTSQIIRDGETLTSSGGKFELGFFSPGNSTNRYVGIWYNNISERTYVWVANREFPLTTNSGVFRVTEPGKLSILNETNGTDLWSTNTSKTIQNPSLQLLDTGNLVLKDANDDRAENYIWQSFDYPSDTFLPGMSLGWNFVTGVETYVSSWRSRDDPYPGEFTIHFDPAGLPQMLMKQGGDVRFRIGPWNGLYFSGSPNIYYKKTIYTTPIYRSVLINENEVKYKEDIADASILMRSIVDVDGGGHRWIWDNRTQMWDIYSYLGEDSCDGYNLCGANGVCDIGKSPQCGCLDKFVVKDGKKSCVRRKELACGGDRFLKYPGIKLPDARNSTLDGRRMQLADCEAECLKNCTCVAYAQLDIREEGSGCLFYYGDLVDIRTVAQDGQDLYIRLASSEVDSKGNKRVILIATFTSAAGVVVVCLGLFLFCRQRRKNDPNMREGPVKEAELPFFNFSTILHATDSFSFNNKLGEGGFGPVYKGKLNDEQEIAVKRLSKTSLQGVKELKNEVILIAKLQHRNLVRTLGCCVEGEENILVYEYMPNQSLDLILFDKSKGMLLDWQKRFNIINGIAKGLLYLHQDSRLRIIHRDLKASNILLDADMNPKISDFGLARSFGGNQTEAQTTRVVGTYGYMAPEYATDGLFSIKSDVFSFGVLVLELVSGRRNKGFFLKDQNHNLLGHAWRLYKEDNSSELVDPSLGHSFDFSEVMRSIHVGLLCVQQFPEDRPNMSSVVFMLGNEVEVPQAKQPGFLTERDVVASQSSSSSNAVNSGNHITITLPQGR